MGSPALPNNHPDSSVAPRVAVVGPGAIGATFASVALLAGVADLRLYGRTALPRITVNRDGSDAPVTLDSGVSDDPSTVTEPADWVLLSVKTHQVADAAAFSLCRENGLPIVVFDLSDGNIGRVVRGDKIGTLVSRNG